MLEKIKCNKCGNEFNINKGDNIYSRIPCPNCGSTTRKINAIASNGASFSSSFSAKVKIVSKPKILLQTIIVPGNRVTEGHLIEAVTIPWFDIIDIIDKDPSIAFQLSPYQWEEIVAGAYKQSGFDEVILTPKSCDHGRDVIAIKKGVGHVRIIDQVKAYNPDHLVTANDVRALMGVLLGDGASKGFVTTTSDFAPKIKDDPLISQFIPSRIDLINGSILMKRLKEIASKKG